MDMARQFQNLMAIIEQGSLGKAAEALHVSQPALTKSVRRLEEQLGVPLFYRDARGMRPTVYGDVLRVHAQGITIGIEHALREIEALRAGSEGTVRVAAGPLVTNEILSRAVVRLMQEKPKLRISIHTAIGNTSDDLIAGKYDFILALAPAENPPDWLVQRRIFNDGVALIVRHGHPLTHRKQISVADLSQASWILPPAGHYHRRRLERIFEEENLPAPTPAVECGSTDFIKHVVANSDYLGLIAAMGLKTQDRNQLAEIAVRSKFMSRSVSILWRKHQILSASAQLLIDHLEVVCAEIQPGSSDPNP